MENITDDIASLLAELNTEMAVFLLPATIYISVLMVTGLVGNVMVCFYYSFKTKITPTSVFIVVLAMFDLTVCSFSMPIELANNYMYFTFTDDLEAWCKSLRFFNHFASFASTLTLIMIAADRYKHVHRAFSVQMTVSAAKKYCVIITVLAVLISWPTLIIFNSVKFPIPEHMYRENLTGTDCASTTGEAYKPYIWAYNMFQLVAFFVCVILLVAMYGIMGYSLYKHKQQLSKYKCTTTTSVLHKRVFSVSRSNIDNPATTFISTGGLENEQAENKQATTDPDEEIQETENKMKIVKRKSNPNHAPVRETDDVHKEAVRLTVVMVTVTAVFIVSCLPYLALQIWRLYKDNLAVESLTGKDIVAYKIGSRSYLLNSSLNPWIYGIFNSKFRQFYYKLFCCKSS